MTKICAIAEIPTKVGRRGGATFYVHPVETSPESQKRRNGARWCSIHRHQKRQVSAAARKY